MASKTLDAIFEHDTFRLVDPPPSNLREGQRVRLHIEPSEEPDAILDLAADVYAGLSPEEVDEVERIALHRGNFFGGRS